MYRLIRNKRRKGIIGGGLILVTIIIGFATILTLYSDISITRNRVEIKETIIININVNNRGTELLSLMNSQTGNDMYIKILGQMVAQNAPDGLSDEIGATLDKMYESYALILQYSGMTEKTVNNGELSDADEYSMEIPVPGAQPGKLKAYVRFKR